MTLATDDARTDVVAAAAPIATTYTFPTSVVAGQALLLGIGQITAKSMGIVSIVGTVNATGWTLLGSMVDHSSTNLRSFVYGKISGGSGTEVLTITYDGTYNGMLGGCAIDTDGGAITFGQTATVIEHTSTTDLDSNTIDSGTNVGGVLGVVFTGSDQTVTADGSGETDVSDENARIHFIWEPYSSAGVKGIEATSGTNAASLTHLIELIEAASGEAVTGTGAATAAPATSSGSGVRGLQDLAGAVALVAPVATVSGSGDVTAVGPQEITGTGTGTIAAPAVAGTGVRGISGAGTLISTLPTVAGSEGPRAITGTGSNVITLPQIVGAGVRGVVGTGALVSARSIVNGTGAGVISGDNTQHRLAHKSSHKRAIKYAHGRRA